MLFFFPADVFGDFIFDVLRHGEVFPVRSKHVFHPGVVADNLIHFISDSDYPVVRSIRGSWEKTARGNQVRCLYLFNSIRIVC